MNSTPTVTVITATYNWSSALRYAVRSVLWQTFQDYEHLVIGDACTDDSEQVVASFADPRLRWHNLAENYGSQSGPNNKGLEMARGKYVAYLGHDDIWHPTHLATLTRALEETGADFGYTMCELIGPPESPFRLVMGGDPPKNRNPLWFMPPSALMHRRDVIDDIGPWLDYRTIDLPPDHDLVYRALSSGKRFVNARELTVYKFPSAARPRAYIEKPVFQQAEYVRRILEEPDFLQVELTTVLNKCAPRLGPWPRRFSLRQRLRKLILPPGQLVESYRKTRGFEERPDLKPGFKHLINRLLGKYDSVRRRRW